MKICDSLGAPWRAIVSAASYHATLLCIFVLSTCMVSSPWHCNNLGRNGAVLFEKNTKRQGDRIMMCSMWIMCHPMLSQPLRNLQLVPGQGLFPLSKNGRCSLSLQNTEVNWTVNSIRSYVLWSVWLWSSRRQRTCGQLWTVNSNIAWMFLATGFALRFSHNVNESRIFCNCVE